jgi:signal transduction histidine kinase
MASVGLLASGLAHEIKNPLNFIQNGAKIIENELSNINSYKEEGSLESIEMSLEMIERYSIRVDNIVKKMLSLSEKKGDEISVDLKSFITEAFRRELEVCNQKYNIQLSEVLELEDIGQGFISESSIIQVISIIVDNALCSLSSSTKEKKELTLRLWLEDDKLRLSLRDNGNGIKEDILKNIYEPFVTTKQSEDGAGLGLTIANDIVRSEMGSIQIVSEINEFTEVSVTLPLRRTL